MNIFSLILIFFTGGFLEIFTWSLQTKSLIKNRAINTFMFTGVSVLIWYYIIENIINNLNNIWLMASYVLGCALGGVATIHLDTHMDKIAKVRLWKRKRTNRRKKTFKKK